MERKTKQKKIKKEKNINTLKRNKKNIFIKS